MCEISNLTRNSDLTAFRSVLIFRNSGIAGKKKSGISKLDQNLVKFEYRAWERHFAHVSSTTFWQSTMESKCENKIERIFFQNKTGNWNGMHQTIDGDHCSVWDWDLQLEICIMGIRPTDPTHFTDNGLNESKFYIHRLVSFWIRPEYIWLNKWCRCLCSIFQFDHFIVKLQKIQFTNEYISALISEQLKWKKALISANYPCQCHFIRIFTFSTTQ